MVVDVPFAVSVDLILGTYTRSARATLEELGEEEIFSPPLSFGRYFHSLTYFLEGYLIKEWRMTPLVEVTTPYRKLVFACVEVVGKYPVDHTQGYPFIVLGAETYIVDVFPYLSSAVSVLQYPFKHLLDQRGSYGIEDDRARVSYRPASCELIPEWYVSWSRPELTASTKSSLDVFSSVVILQFCLGAEDHEEELLVGVVREPLGVTADFFQE